MPGVMHVRAGGCGGCALEIGATSLAETDLVWTEHPRHASILLVTGAPGPDMLRAVEAAWIAMPEPRWLVLAGDCALDGGPFAGGYAGITGLGERAAVSLRIPGSPPAPAEIVAALRGLRGELVL